jgi:hypothetical protein
MRHSGLSLGDTIYYNASSGPLDHQCDSCCTTHSTHASSEVSICVNTQIKDCIGVPTPPNHAVMSCGVNVANQAAQVAVALMRPLGGTAGKSAHFS